MAFSISIQFWSVHWPRHYCVNALFLFETVGVDDDATQSAMAAKWIPTAALQTMMPIKIVWRFVSHYVWPKYSNTKSKYFLQLICVVVVPPKTQPNKRPRLAIHKNRKSNSNKACCVRAFGANAKWGRDIDTDSSDSKYHVVGRKEKVHHGSSVASDSSSSAGLGFGRTLVYCISISS